MRTVVVLVLSSIVLAGCAAPASRDASVATDERARADLARFLDGLYDPDGRFAHEPGFSAYGSVANVTAPDGTPLSIVSRFARGVGDSTLDTSEPSGPVPGTFVLCTPDALYLRVGRGTFETRRAFGVPCGGGSIAGGPPQALDAYELVNVTALPEGRVRGAWTFAAEVPGAVVLVSDAEERVERVDLQLGGTRASFDLEYGPRATHAPPGESVRLPADVAFSQQDDGTTLAWTITRTEERPRYAELRGMLGGKAGDIARAEFALADEPTAQDAYTWSLVDADGDGRASPGDTGSVARTDGAPLGEVTLSFMDAWAGRAVDERQRMLLDAVSGL